MAMEIMVFITNPSDMDNWPLEKRLERQRCVLDWHDYICKLNPTKVPQVWGSNQILSQVRYCCVQHVLVAVYKVDSLSEFDELLVEDPLREISKYQTVMLTDVRNDLKTDKDRFDQTLESISKNVDKKMLNEHEKIRSLFKSAPEYVGKFDKITPPNKDVLYNPRKRKDEIDSELQILIHGMNPPEYMEWDDVRKLVHYEKVLWWHDHVADMIDKEKMSHVWGTHDFCDIELMSYRSAAGVAVYKVKDLDEWDDIYRLDPLRESGRFQSIILKDISEERELDIKRLEKLERQFKQN
jgi:hypothetical protein